MVITKGTHKGEVRGGIEPSTSPITCQRFNHCAKGAVLLYKPPNKYLMSTIDCRWEVMAAPYLMVHRPRPRILIMQ
jgi:hypothetical protein